MIDYPNREHKNADEAARRRALSTLDNITDEADTLRRRLTPVRRSAQIDGDDSQRLSSLVRDLTQQLSILGTLREVREWDAADRAQQGRG